jgi:hypothetical protein
MCSILNPDVKAALIFTSDQLFHELMMHHHNYLLAKRFKNEDLHGVDPRYKETYFKHVESHNYAMLALTLCKVMEFHSAFRTHLPTDLRDELDSINARVARSRILHYRNKFVGHLFDSKTKLPINPKAIADYWKVLLDGQSEEEFRCWWWSTRNEPDLKSVAGLMARIEDRFRPD